MALPCRMVHALLIVGLVACHGADLGVAADQLEQQCADNGNGCQDGVVSSNMLQRLRRLEPHLTGLEEDVGNARDPNATQNENATQPGVWCAPLFRDGLALEGCGSLAPGRSCEVACPAGLVGRSVRYYCFSALALAGKPPAALREPLCRNHTSGAFPQGQEMTLAVGFRGCLSCTVKGKLCDVLPNASKDDEGCSVFKIDLAQNRIQKAPELSHCLDLFSGGIGLWRCNGASSNQIFFEEPSEVFPDMKALCVSSPRGRLCLDHAGQRTPFFDSPSDASLLRPAWGAFASGDEQGFLHRTYALQVCRAKLESTAPDSFWDWLQTQDFKLVQALLATYPVHPGQVKLFHEIREFVGHERFERLGMASFAVALSYANRMKGSLDAAVLMPHPGYEQNQAGFLAEETERFKQEMIEGKHCRLQSNACTHLHRCCGAPETWKFKWPRDPTPSVRDWVAYWLRSVEQHRDQLWANPLDMPWTVALYVWPSPIKECEWVQKKLIHQEPMEGKWYFYDALFHKSVCEGGQYHPDSIMGIATYGGLCGRMANIEWRKSGCMGMSATMKGEPGHCAGLKYTSTTASFTSLNVITDVSSFFIAKVLPDDTKYLTLEAAGSQEAFPLDSGATCLKCPRRGRCEVLPGGSPDCSRFLLDMEGFGRLRAETGGGCVDVLPGPSVGVYGCSKASNGNQNVEEDQEGHLLIRSPRGVQYFRATELAAEAFRDECLACTAGRGQACGRAPPDSASCTHFELDEESGLLGVVNMKYGLEVRSNGELGLGRHRYPNSQHQRTTSTEEGYRRFVSNRISGSLRVELVPVAANESERGRCLVCTERFKECNFAKAGSSECTVFAYDPKTGFLGAGWDNLCLHTRRKPGFPPRPGIWKCGRPNEVFPAKLDEQGRLEIPNRDGQVLHFHVPNNGSLPPAETKWTLQGFHRIFVSCEGLTCNFPSLLALDSKQALEWRHEEVARANAQSFNDHEHSGLYPTAHDEARLVASLVFALRKEGGAPDDELAPLLAWALKRNPALWEAWELAADFPAGGALNASDMPTRTVPMAKIYFKVLTLLRVTGAQSTEAQAAADGFARQHLLQPGQPERWLQLPQLHRSLVARLCGALSETVLGELGEASDTCRLLRRLAAGEGWEELEQDMLEADDADDANTNNVPNQAFQRGWEALARLAVEPGQQQQAQRLAAITEGLLGKLGVAFVNQRSETFYGEHGRLLLRSTFAHVLQLSAAVLPESRRQELFESTKRMLEQPLEAPERLRGHKTLVEGFLDWLTQHQHQAGAANRTVLEATSVADSVNGFLASDSPSPDLHDEMVLDRDATMERGAVFFDDTEARSFDVEALLRTLLRLEGPGEESPENPDEDGGLAAAASATAALLQQRQDRELSAEASQGQHTTTPSNSELLQMCVDDMFGR